MFIFYSIVNHSMSHPHPSISPYVCFTLPHQPCLCLPHYFTPLSLSTLFPPISFINSLPPDTLYRLNIAQAHSRLSPTAALCFAK